MKYRVITVASLLVAMSGAAAQDQTPMRVEVRPFAGKYVPTGSQRSDFKTATMFGLQGALEMSRFFHVLGSFAWIDGQTKIATLDKTAAYVMQYDVGTEFNGYVELREQWLFRPFVGVGAGARTYDYQATGVTNKTCAAGYGSFGTELQRSWLAIRLEGRGYANCFRSPVTGEQRFRNDAMFAFGFAYHIN